MINLIETIEPKEIREKLMLEHKEFLNKGKKQILTCCDNILKKIVKI